jgi:hypothetical protein
MFFSYTSTLAAVTDFLWIAMAMTDLFEMQMHCNLQNTNLLQVVVISFTLQEQSQLSEQLLVFHLQLVEWIQQWKWNEPQPPAAKCGGQRASGASLRVCLVPLQKQLPELFLKKLYQTG